MSGQLNQKESSPMHYPRTSLALTVSKTAAGQITEAQAAVPSSQTEFARLLEKIGNGSLEALMERSTDFPMATKSSGKVRVIERSGAVLIFKVENTGFPATENDPESVPAEVAILGAYRYANSRPAAYSTGSYEDDGANEEGDDD